MSKTSRTIKEISERTNKKIDEALLEYEAVEEAARKKYHRAKDRALVTYDKAIKLLREQK